MGYNRLYDRVFKLMMPAVTGGGGNDHESACTIMHRMIDSTLFFPPCERSLNVTTADHDVYSQDHVVYAQHCISLPSNMIMAYSFKQMTAPELYQRNLYRILAYLSVILVAYHAMPCRDEYIMSEREGGGCVSKSNAHIHVQE